MHKENQLEVFKRCVEATAGVTLPDVPEKRHATRTVLDSSTSFMSEWRYGGMMRKLAAVPVGLIGMMLMIIFTVIFLLLNLLAFFVLLPILIMLLQTMWVTTKLAGSQRSSVW